MVAKVPTKPVKVTITTDDFLIQGYLHIKVGGYQSRISDLLNNKDARFIPITDAEFVDINNRVEPPQYTDTMIVRIDSIKAVVPDTADEANAARQIQSPRWGDNASPEAWTKPGAASAGGEGNP